MTQEPSNRNRPHLLSYLVILFSAAFLLLLMSYFMQQRESDQQVIDGLQKNMSAMQEMDQSLVWEDPTRHGATKLVHQNC